MRRTHTILCPTPSAVARTLLVVPAVVLGTAIVHSATLHVAPGGSNVPPFASWATAATDIQTAVDAAQSGDAVLVGPGVYATSKKGVRSRVIIEKPIVVRSSDGPGATIIAGAGPVSKTSVRCVYLSNGAVLEGFTLRDGHASKYGSKDGDRAGGGAFVTGGATISNCSVEGCNSIGKGAGVFILGDGRVEACSIIGCGNPKVLGGGVACVGGGAISASTICDNTARYGGGVYCYGGGTIEQCWLQNNQAAKTGGGVYSVYGGEIANSAVLQNRAPSGGGIYAKATAGMRNCTVTGNSATKSGGVLLSKTTGIWNSIIYYNDAPKYPNWFSKDPFLHCCMAPLPRRYRALGADPGVISVDNPRLVQDSICINAGNNAYAAGNNVFGGPRIYGAIVDIGCDEYHGGYTGALAVAFSVDFPRAALHYPVTFTADIDGMAAGYVWDFGDGACASNCAVIQHAFAATGVFAVTLTAWNTETSAVAVAAQTICLVYTNYVSLQAATSGRSAHGRQPLPPCTPPLMKSYRGALCWSATVPIVLPAPSRSRKTSALSALRARVPPRSMLAAPAASSTSTMLTRWYRASP